MDYDDFDDGYEDGAGNDRRRKPKKKEPQRPAPEVPPGAVYALAKQIDLHKSDPAQAPFKSIAAVFIHGCDGKKHCKKVQLDFRHLANAATRGLVNERNDRRALETLQEWVKQQQQSPNYKAFLRSNNLG